MPITILETLRQLVGLSPTIVLEDLAGLRKSCVTPEQADRYQKLKADFDELHRAGADLHRPSTRLRGVLFAYGVKSLDELSGTDREEAEGAGILHLHECVVRIDASKLLPRDLPILTGTADLLRELRASYAVMLADATARVQSELTALFSKYGATDSVESTAFMRQLRQEAIQHASPIGPGVRKEPRELNGFID